MLLDAKHNKDGQQAQSRQPLIDKNSIINLFFPHPPSWGLKYFLLLKNKKMLGRQNKFFVTNIQKLLKKLGLGVSTTVLCTAVKKAL